MIQISNGIQLRYFIQNRSLSLKQLKVVRMELNVILHESGNEVVRMVVTSLHSDGCWVTLFSTNLLEGVGLQLI